MRLQNRKTGEKATFVYLQNDYVSPLVLTVDIDGEIKMLKYNSLAELNNDWEDYEEPKSSALDLTVLTLTNFIENEPDENKVDLEDCKRLLEKLKAWKRLKDKGFRFTGHFLGTEGLNIHYECDMKNDISDDLDLLFSGEDD